MVDAEHDTSDEEHGSYFAPMADLLAGILFVILILLMSFAIIHYPDDVSQPATPLKTTSAPSLRVPEVDTRMQRLAQITQARTALLRDIQADLILAGIMAQIDADNGILRFDDKVFFQADSSRLVRFGDRNAQVVATIIIRRIRCFLPGATANLADCPTPPAVLLDGLFLDVFASPDDFNGNKAFTEPASFAGARALAFFSAFAEGEPSYLLMRNGTGFQMVNAAGRVLTGDARQPRVAIGFAMIAAPPPIPQVPLSIVPASEPH